MSDSIILSGNRAVFRLPSEKVAARFYPVEYLIENKEDREKFFSVGRFWIWSSQWGAWWRPDGKGYSESINDAGIYEKDDVWIRVCHVGPEKRIVIIRVPRVYEEALMLRNLEENLKKVTNASQV